MSDQSVDVTMEAVVMQYREELANQMSEKLLLQAAVKILNEQIAGLQVQIQQLAADLQTAVQVQQPPPESSFAGLMDPPADGTLPS